MADIINEIEENIENALEEVSEKAEDSEEKPAKKPRKTKAKKKEEDKIDEKLIKEAEKESTEKTIEQKKKELLEKAEKLKAKIEEVSTEELKEQIKAKKKGEMLLPLEEYVKAGIYLGTKVVTPDMRPFVYRRRADGLAIFNTDLIDEKLKEAIEFLKKFDAKDIIVICKREAGWKAVEMFSSITGIRAFTKKYPAGILTNTALPTFFENELTIICDSWLDKNALNDTLKAKKKILMICDTNNFAKNTDEIIIGNNKSSKSLGIIFYLLTKEYCKAKNISANIPDLEWWTEDSGEQRN